MSSKLPVKCPVCDYVFSIDVSELSGKPIVCPKCKTPLALTVLPLAGKDLITLSYISLLNNLNKLYDALAKKIEKM